MDREMKGKALVSDANSIDDIFSILTAFKKYRKMNISCSFKRYEELTKDEKSWVFELLEKNMKTHYEGCESIGWDEKAKKKELEHEDCRYIIAYEEEVEETKQENVKQDPNNEKKAPTKQQPVGYVMWRSLMDDNGMGEFIPVLYLWEIHLEKQARRKGLGKFLMTISELAAWKLKMKKIILTAFSSNEPSIKFFQEKLKFNVDETDPQLCDPSEPPCGYRILSKSREI